MVTVQLDATVRNTAFATAASITFATNPMQIIVLCNREVREIDNLASMAAVVICCQHIKIIYNVKRFSSDMIQIKLIGYRPTAPNLAVHLVKEIVIAL